MKTERARNARALRYPGDVSRAVVVALAVLGAGVAAAEDPVTLDVLQVEGAGGTDELGLERPARSVSRLGVPLEDLPASATIIDAETQRRRGVRTTREAVEAAGGFTGGEPPGAPASFSSRGFTGNDITILYDGVRVAEPGMFARPGSNWLYDRVEILRGPASVLHGEGAVAGAINFVPRRPDPDRSSGELLLGAGSFGETRVAAGAGGPTAVDGLSYRVDASRLARDGEIDRSGARYESLGGSLRLDASRRLRFTLSAEVQRDDIEPYFGTPVIDGGIDRRTVGNNYNVADAEMDMVGYWLRFDTDFAATDRLRLRNRVYAYTGERNWKNMEAYSYDPDQDVIRRSVPIRITHDQTLFGNRLEAIHDHTLFGLSHRVSVGLDISRNRFEHINNAPYQGADTVDVDDPDPGLYFSDTSFEPGVRTTNDRYAVFGENRLRLGGGLSLVGGLRHELIRLDGEDLRAGERATERYRPTTGRIGAVWDLPAGVTTYAQYATGAKPTGSTVTFSPGDEGDRLERSRGVELGVRHRAWGDRLQWSAAAYDIAKRNLTVRDPDNRDLERQIGRQESRGVELAVVVRPWRSWRFRADGTLLNAEFADYATADGRYDGNTPPNVPERLANLRAEWFATDRLTLKASLRYVGPRQGDDANTVDVPSYTLFGAAATWQLRQLEITLRGRNLTDEQHVTWSSFGGSQWLLGDSRSVDLTLSTQF
ncbi:TonB-dependent siderophore receptor [Aquisalimonas lutea]|uniref:TonB-dependent receptor n=1 Tax=Aquisalimonas lutea TaxID=1327750 RepID=UPI0025B4413B|nr:TonB-dependent siderophore receptor [Aquisalimonas lutea]MDN3516776.1 TonB-dependent siderophore receptor [Aquisalimonas lutea]